MIKASELNVGNLFHRINRSQEVHLPDTSTVFEITAIPSFGVEAVRLGEIPAQVEHHAIIEFYNLSPIPLTEEWLLRLGFKKYGSDDGTEQWWLMEKSSESYTGEICLLSLSWHCYKNFFFYKSLNHKIYHVHQLQNLYHALSGQELTIKPTQKNQTN